MNFTIVIFSDASCGFEFATFQICGEFFKMSITLDLSPHSLLDWPTRKGAIPSDGAKSYSADSDVATISLIRKQVATEVSEL